MALPADLSLVTVTGTLLYLDGTTVGTSATVAFALTDSPWLRDSGDALIAPKTITCTVDVDGHIVGPAGLVGVGGVGVTLPATDDTDVSPTGTTYTVTVTIPDGPQLPPFMIALPSTPTTVDLSDLVPVVDLPPTGAPITQTEADTRYQRLRAPATLTVVSGIIATDASTVDYGRVVLGADATLDNPTSPFDGAWITWEISQDSTGGHTLTLGSKFDVRPSIGTVTIATAANAKAFLRAVYSAPADRWYVLAWDKGA